jgi:hypothetical protein
MSDTIALKTTVVNKRHNVPYDVYIGRGSIWGNPFVSAGTATGKRSSRSTSFTFSPARCSWPDCMS